MYTIIDLISHNGFLQEISHRMRNRGFNMRWEVPFYENISTIVCLSRIYKYCTIDVSMTSYSRSTILPRPDNSWFVTIIVSSYRQPLSCNVKRWKNQLPNLLQKRNKLQSYSIVSSFAPALFCATSRYSWNTANAGIKHLIVTVY